MRVWLPFILALSLVGFAVAPIGSSAAVLRGSISYSKSGGIAGIEESMKIDRNARGKIARRTFKLPRREGRRLATAIRRADLADVKSPKEPTCCDFFSYEIRYRGHTVTFDDGNADQVPRGVRELQELLAALYETYAN